MQAGPGPTVRADGLLTPCFVITHRALASQKEEDFEAGFVWPKPLQHSSLTSEAFGARLAQSNFFSKISKAASSLGIK